MSDQIQVGDLVTFTAAFAAVATNAAVNPTTVVITVRDPNGNPTTPVVSNPSLGVYQAQETITIPGLWQWKATGTGAAVAQGWASFTVPVPPF